MKILFKLGLLASAMMTFATSVFAITPETQIGLTTTNIVTVPEPSTLGLLGAGLAILALLKRKK